MVRKTVIFGVIISLTISTHVFASSCHSSHEKKGSITGQEQKGSMPGYMKDETSAAVEIGNKICPVSGEEVGKMGPAVKYEYKGKIYNLCCVSCIDEFKNDPQKYIKKVEEEIQTESKGQSEHEERGIEMMQGAETSHQGTHQGHHH